MIDILSFSNAIRLGWFVNCQVGDQSLQMYKSILMSSKSTAYKIIQSFPGTYGPRREKTCLWEFANNTGAYQPAHPRSLVSAFVIRLLDSTLICNLPTGEISIF